MNNDLISREALLEKECCGRISGNDVRNAPAVDAAPVRHGRWIEGTLSSRLICSECGHEAIYNENANEPYFTKFCPECGAMMDE